MHMDAGGYKYHSLKMLDYKLMKIEGLDSIDAKLNTDSYKYYTNVIDDLANNLADEKLADTLSKGVSYMPGYADDTLKMIYGYFLDNTGVGKFHIAKTCVGIYCRNLDQVLKTPSLFVRWQENEDIYQKTLDELDGIEELAKDKMSDVADISELVKISREALDKKISINAVDFLKRRQAFNPQ